MRKTGITNRMIAIVLTLLMSVSVAASSLSFTYALETGEAREQGDEESDKDPAAAGEENEISDISGGDGIAAEDASGGPDISVTDGAETDTEELPEVSMGLMSAEVADIEVRAAGDEGIITSVWNPVAGVDHYMVYLDSDTAGTRVEASDACRSIFRNTDVSIVHTVTVKAFSADDRLLAEGSAEDIGAFIRNRLSGKPSRGAASLGINLKTLLGEKYSGYSVVQGGCTDGTYAYYLMVSPSSQQGKVLKTLVGGGSVVSRSGRVDIEHGNGMTIDTSNNRLVAVGRGDRKNELTTIDANNLSTVRHYNVNYSYAAATDWNTSYRKSKGLAAISYIPKYDVYVALQRTTHDLLILDQNFRAIGLVETKITSDYPGTYQAMDADEKYVYLLLSKYQDNPSKQKYNIIVALDWNSENLLDYANGSVPYAAKCWKCGNDNSGSPDSVIRIKTPYEAENIYHIDQGDGTAKFYLSEYYNNPQYRIVTKKKAYKVKWKKVKKRVKWKKVKKHGKWKWKYKKKKVWKYKKKYKKVKVKVFDHYNREGYVYDLGTF